jgi:membrane-associated phospholipid phosphatase
MFDIFLEPGITLILFLQSWGEWLQIPMQFFSFLGNEEFFLFALPVLYWSVDAALGLRVGLILLLSTGLNDFFKLAFHGARPYWFNPQVRAYSSETSFGVPSGHAQNAASLWGMLAWYTQKRWAWAGALGLALLIGFSRMYLGVHFPHDVFFGWLLGYTLLWALLRLWEPVSALLRQKSMPQQMGLAFLLSVLVLIGGILAFGTLRDWQLPAIWSENALAAGAEAAPNPVTLNTTLTTSGTLFGLLAGLAWMNQRGGYRADGTLVQRGLRLLLGLVGILLLWYGLGAVFPRGEEIIPYALRYLRYSLLGGWISAGAPWLFLRINLAHRQIA